MTSRVDEILREGYVLMSEFGFPGPSREECSEISETVFAAMDGRDEAVHLAAACQAYYIFRMLHSKKDIGIEASTLLGDYFFSLFLKLMLPLDDKLLLDRFSERLTEDCEKSVRHGKETDIKKYLKFVKDICKGYLSGGKYN